MLSLASQLLSVSLHADPTSSALLLLCPIFPTLPTDFSPRFGCAVLPFAIRAEQMEISPSFHVEPWTSSQCPRWSCTPHIHPLLWKEAGLQFLLKSHLHGIALVKSTSGAAGSRRKPKSRG